MAAAGAWFALPSLGGVSLASGLALASVSLALLSLGMPGPTDTRAQSARRLVAPIAGGFAALIAFVSLSLWMLTTFTLASAFALGALARERPGSVAREAAWSMGLALAVPAAFGLVLTFAGAGSLLVTTLRVAAPVAPLELAARTTCRALVAVVCLRPAEVRARLGLLLAFAATALVALRVAFVASLARVDGELYWPETPLLVNALKLENHQRLYGDPTALDSYSYSPLLDVIHRALLRPFGLGLELFAHRGLVLFDQAAAFAILLWALWKPLRNLAVPLQVTAGATLAFAALANLLAPAVHPDHPLLLCFAVAVALVVAPERFSPRLRDAALLLVTPAAAAFKLSGAGIGAALAIAAMARRDKRSLALLAGSGALTVGTIPLFDALFGSFSFYAITVQRSHPMEWRRLLEVPYLLYFAYAVGSVLAVFAFLRRGAIPAETRAKTSALLALATCIALFSLPGAAKHAGRENNLSLLFVGFTVLCVFLAAHAPRYAAGLFAFVIWGALLTRPPSLPLASDQRRAIAEDTRALAEIVERDAREGEQTLLLTTVLPWIRAGRTDAPRDRYHSAVELFFGGFPEGRLLFERIASGKYRTVVVSAGDRSARGGPTDEFEAAIRESIARAYVERPRPKTSTAPSSNARVYVRVPGPASR